ncbi:MAG: DUF1501 domain-containing protein [Verrucomicrobiota bacterium]
MSLNFNTRRDFLRTTLLGGAIGYSIPAFLLETMNQLQAETLHSATAVSTGKDAPILVVIQLAGGNDGLNTVVPYTNDFYFNARPGLKVDPLQVLKINDTLGFHPNLTGLQKLYGAGNLALVQGVGYPNPNRSHFRSTEIWHTGSDSDRNEKYGWIGKYFDSCCQGEDPTVGINIGQQSPQAFSAKKPTGVSLSNPETYRFVSSDRDSGGENSTESVFRQLNQMDHTPDNSDSNSGQTIQMIGGNTHFEGSPVDFLERTSLDAQVSSDQILIVARKSKNSVDYPKNAFANELKLIARLIGGGMSTRVYYTSQGGYDTHTNQINSHNRLMSELGDSLFSFCEDLKQQGNFGRVTILTFSEFGRRVAQNANGGTDHGAAAPLYVMGGQVKGGLYGKYPSLAPQDLHDGDLVHQVDFREVYAGILEKTLKVSSNEILGKTFTPLNVFG